MKKLMTFLCAMVCALALTACGASSEVKESAVDPSMVETYVNALFEQFSSMDEASMDKLLNSKNSEIAATTEQALVVKRAVTSWKDAQKDLGAFVSVGDFSMEEGKDTITGTLHLVYAQRDADLIVIFNDDLTDFEAIKMQPVYTLGETMGNAGLNTLMGMGIVFLVLIFIAILISLFKYINKIEKAIADRKERKAQSGIVIPQSSEVAPAPVVPVFEVEEQIDDLELIAVITAAIAASMNTSVDNLVVRSIRKRKNGR